MFSLDARAALSCALCALVLSGCGILKKKQAEPAASASTALVAPPPPVPVAPVAPAVPEVSVADDAVATPEDFEDEAAEKVTDKNYKAQLQSLKQEIQAK
jgi:hypothetical protein